ncbi:hypothetical protein [Brevibacillus halotolerans]|uniref:hypothetical protein n=1 Tax=Brevibacillus halotolerans TaxID=1507437 RepID=UPI0015EF8E71|nr:hypothetical protein [Brevibacillus halotolerans]MBA4535490.1 hypothetical protein [Brevibacillus halotolerans]
MMEIEHAAGAGLDLKIAGDMPTAADIFSSAVSLAANFWPYVLLGIAILLAPRIFATMKSAIASKNKS